MRLFGLWLLTWLWMTLAYLWIRLRWEMHRG